MLVLDNQNFGVANVFGLPSDFSWAPFSKYFIDGFGQASANFDVTDYYVATEPQGTPVVWISYANGSDSAAGTSDAPVKTIKSITDNDVSGVIWLLDGVHYASADISMSGAASLRIKSFSGKQVTVRFAFDPALVAFTAMAAQGAPKLYKAVMSPPQRVLDTAITDGYGNYLEMVHRGNTSDVNTNPGSWYHDGATLYVRMFTDRAPGTNILMTNGASLKVIGNNALYTENVTFEGGGGVQVTSDNAHVPRLYMKNSKVGFAANNSVQCVGGKVFTQDSEFYHPGLDNLNYSDNADGSLNSLFIEFNDICRDSSTTSSASNNASTCHGSTKGIRINGKYFNCNGPVIADTVDSRTYNICTDAYRANAGGGGGNLGNYFSHASTVMWLHNPRSKLTTYDFFTDSGGVINVSGAMSDAISNDASVPAVFDPIIVS